MHVKEDHWASRWQVTTDTDSTASEDEKPAR